MKRHALAAGPPTHARRASGAGQREAFALLRAQLRAASFPLSASGSLREEMRLRQLVRGLAGYGRLMMPASPSSVPNASA